MLIESKYDLGQIVFLKTDSEQKERIICTMSCRQTGVMYELGSGHASSWHYDFEFTVEKNELKAILQK